MAKPLIVEVKEYRCKCNQPRCTLHDGRKGYGVTAGKKWHAYLFANKFGAQTFAEMLGNDQQRIAVNVGYPAPFAWCKEDRKEET